MKNKYIVIFLFVLFLSIILPVTAQDKEAENQILPDMKQTLALKKNDSFSFGKFAQDSSLENGKESIDWIVLSYDGDHQSYIMISKYALFSIDNQEPGPDPVQTWKDLLIRFSEFSEKEDKCDKDFFFLNSKEVEDYFPEVTERPALFTEYAHKFDKTSEYANWWVPGDPEKGTGEQLVDGSGKFIPYDRDNSELHAFLRPAMRIGLDCFSYSSEDMSGSVTEDASGTGIDSADGVPEGSVLPNGTDAAAGSDETVTRENSGIIEPGAGAETTDPGETTETTEPGETTETTEPGETTETTEPEETTETTEPGETTETTEPGETTETTEPGETTETTEPGETTETTEPGETTEPTEPGETTEPTESGETTGPTEPGETTEPAEPTEETKKSGIKRLMSNPILLIGVCLALAAAITDVVIHNRKETGSQKSGHYSPITDSEPVPDTNQTFHITGHLIKPGACQCGSCIGQGKRSYQEDSLYYFDDDSPEKPAWAVIADGMGGMDNGAESSIRAIEILKRLVPRIRDEKEIPYKLWEIGNAVNQSIYEMNTAKGMNGGSTLICVYIIRDHLYWISIGDSRIYLYRDGMLALINEEHELENRLYSGMINGDIDLYDVREMERRELRKLTSNLGRESLTIIDRNIMPYKLQKGDKVLLCSDGVSGTLDDHELIACLQDASPDVNCSMIAEMVEAKNKRGQDNYSAIVVYCDVEDGK